MSRSRLRLHVNQDNVVETVYRAIYSESGLLNIVLDHMARGGKAKN